MLKFQYVCSITPTDFLKNLGKEEIILQIEKSKIKLINKCDFIELNVVISRKSKGKADQKFLLLIEILKSIILFNTHIPIKISSLNIYDVNSKKWSSEFILREFVDDRNDLPDPSFILENLNFALKSIEIQNSMYYYRLALLSDDPKNAILNLYKVVESIIGYPKGDDEKFKSSLKKLRMLSLLNDFKRLRKLRNSYDSGHAAGGKSAGKVLYRYIDIPPKALRKNRNLIKILICNAIKFLKKGHLISEVFIADR